MFDWLKNTFKKLCSSHQSEMEKEFHTVRKILLARRLELAQLIAEEVQLQRRLEKATSNRVLTDALNGELNSLREKKEIARNDLSDIENEVQLAFTKKEILLAQRNDETETKNLSRELKITLAVLLIWQITGLILKLRPLL